MAHASEEQRAWEAHIELFKSMTPPYRVDPVEKAHYQAVISEMAASAQARGLRVLLLGMTPEIVDLNWPEGSRLVVADRSEAMIHGFWPGDIPGVREICRKDWLELPFEAGSFDLVLGDGVFNLMAYPDGFQALGRTASELLAADGKLCVRVFLQSEPREESGALVQEIKDSERVDFYGMRLRIASSLQNSTEEGYLLTKASLDAFLEEQGVAMKTLIAKSGYRPPGVAAKSGGGLRITYPTADEFTATLGEWFTCESLHHGSHPLAHRTPIFQMRNCA